MNSKVYKTCAVPECVNTSIKTPNKLFVYVPRNKGTINKGTYMEVFTFLNSDEQKS